MTGFRDSFDRRYRQLTHAGINAMADGVSSRPTLSVVIASRDRQELLRACLESVRRCTCEPHEIIVVDSASHDPEATARVAREFRASFIRTDIPGAGLARNLGAVAARGEIVAFTDDDALVDAWWVDALMGTFADPSVDASVGPVFVQGSEPPAAMRVGATIDPTTDEARFSSADSGWFNRLAFGAIGYGANLAVRRSTFERYGLFRNCLGAGAPIPGDENYFLFSLVSHGGLVVNEPRARVTHPPQPPERIRELRRATLAYLLYVVSTQPHLFTKTVRHVMRRFSRDRRNAPHGTRPGSWRLADLVQIVAAAPTLLFSAWQVERRLAKTVIAPHRS